MSLKGLEKASLMAVEGCTNFLSVYTSVEREECYHEKLVTEHRITSLLSLNSPDLLRSPLIYTSPSQFLAFAFLLYLEMGSAH